MYVTIKNNRIAFTDKNEERLFTALGQKRHPSEQRWVVPSSYYDDWRDWFGWTHCDVSYFVAGALCIYGPPRSGGRNRDWLTGKPVLFESAGEGGPNVPAGYYSTILTPLDKFIQVRTHRLVPIELCEPATIETWFLMQEGLVYNVD